MMTTDFSENASQSCSRSIRTSRILSRRGRSPRHASSGDTIAEAAAAVQRGEVDLAIVEFDLPNGEGISLIENLREVEPEIPVLALIASRDLERHARALRAGADEVLSTASSGEKIVGVVQRLVCR